MQLKQLLLCLICNAEPGLRLTVYATRCCKAKLDFAEDVVVPWPCSSTHCPCWSLAMLLNIMRILPARPHTLKQFNKPAQLHDPHSIGSTAKDTPA